MRKPDKGSKDYNSVCVQYNPGFAWSSPRAGKVPDPGPQLDVDIDIKFYDDLRRPIAPHPVWRWLRMRR